MEKIIVVIVILVLVFVIYFLAMGKRGGKTEENEVPAASPRRKQTDVSSMPMKKEWEDVGTRIVSKLSMEQLDRNGRVVRIFDINEIPPEGVTVSRPGAKLGDVILSADGGDDAMTVGTEAIVLGEDEKGMFGKIYDNGREKNKLYLFDPVTNRSREVRQFDIADQTMICIGCQWLRFIVPTVPGAPVPVSSAPVDPAVFTSTPQNPGKSSFAQPAAPSGFSFESSRDDSGRFVITRK